MPHVITTDTVLDGPNEDDLFKALRNRYGHPIMKFTLSAVPAKSGAVRISRRSFCIHGLIAGIEVDPFCATSWYVLLQVMSGDHPLRQVETGSVQMVEIRYDSVAMNGSVVTTDVHSSDWPMTVPEVASSTSGAPGVRRRVIRAGGGRGGGMHSHF